MHVPSDYCKRNCRYNQSSSNHSCTITYTAFASHTLFIILADKMVRKEGFTAAGGTEYELVAVGDDSLAHGIYRCRRDRV